MDFLQKGIQTFGSISHPGCCPKCGCSGALKSPGGINRFTKAGHIKCKCHHGNPHCPYATAGGCKWHN